MPENSERRHCSCQALSLCKKARRKLMHLSLRLAFARTDCTPMTHCVPMGRNSCGFKDFSGAAGQIRTADLVITNYARPVLACCRLLQLIVKSRCAARETGFCLLLLVVAYRGLQYAVFRCRYGFCMVFLKPIPSDLIPYLRLS